MLEIMVINPLKKNIIILLRGPLDIRNLEESGGGELLIEGLVDGLLDVVPRPGLLEVTGEETVWKKRSESRTESLESSVHLSSSPVQPRSFTLSCKTPVGCCWIPAGGREDKVTESIIPREKICSRVHPRSQLLSGLISL